MTAPRRWPATAKMRTLFEAGLTFAEIADFVYRTEPGWDAPPYRSTIKRYYEQIGMPSRRPTSASAKKLIPWQVKTEHSTHLFRHMLAAEARKRERKTLTDTDRKLLSRLHELLFGRGTLFVVDYGQEGGWCLRLREDDDEDIIRAPVECNVLRLDVQTALSEAASDRSLAEAALREGVSPRLLENRGRDAAADILRALIAARDGVQQADGTPPRKRNGVRAVQSEPSELHRRAGSA